MPGDLSTKVAAESDWEKNDDKNDKKDGRKKKIIVNEEGIADDGTGIKKKKKKANKKKLIMCIAQTKYYVVRYVAKNIFKMRLTHDETEDWDICW